MATVVSQLENVPVTKAEVAGYGHMKVTSVTSSNEDEAGCCDLDRLL